MTIPIDKIGAPRISVVIPAYNSADTIRETVESVLNQTFSDFEIIVIDDGSQDATLEILTRIQDLRLKVFSYPNAGASTSRNRGLALARGKFIAFLDADDLWTPDKLEAQLNALQANPQASVAYSWTDFIDKDGRFLWSGLHITVNGDALEKLLVVNFLENGSNPLIRKQALTEVGGFDPSLGSAEDWELWLRLAAYYQFVAVPKPQILYRRTSSSKSANILRHEAASLSVIDLAFARAPANLQYLKRRSLTHLYKYLTSRVTYGLPARYKGVLTLKFLGRAIRYDPTLPFKQLRFVAASLLKAVTMILVPAQLAEVILTKAKSLKG